MSFLQMKKDILDNAVKLFKCMIVFNLAIIRLVAEAIGEDEDELLDSVLEVISDKRDDLRTLIFEGR